MRRVIFNQKGGVGKSTFACNLAAISAAVGRKTQLIDLDVQGNSTHYLLGKQVQNENQTLATFFRKNLSLTPFASEPSCSLNEIAQPTPFENLSIICPDVEMEWLRARLESRHKIHKLGDALSEQSQFDEVYIDTPSVLNFYSLSALIASQDGSQPKT